MIVALGIYAQFCENVLVVNGTEDVGRRSRHVEFGVKVDASRTRHLDRQTHLRRFATLSSRQIFGVNVQLTERRYL